MKKLIAHINNSNSENMTQPHLLTEHLENTAEYAAHFSKVFGLSKIASILGLTHDIGKSSKNFQQYIRSESGFDAHLEGKSMRHVDHSSAGAKYLVEKYGSITGFLLAYIVAGHHAGLPDGKGESESVLSRRLAKSVNDFSVVLPWIESKLPVELTRDDFIPSKYDQKNILQPHFLIRMLYSVLTDADFLDTESYMNPDKSHTRDIGYPSVREIRDHLFAYLQTLKNNPLTEINVKRNKILKWCIESAELMPGLFSLTVPTGGGKTISSMAFGLEHAVLHGMRRIIYVIPYTTIIEQNAGVFRDIFDNLNTNIILEHHSNFEPEIEDAFNRLASENWDVPIVITTNVRFFESFYSNRSSACRRLHNIAGSVIVFDEAHMIPRDHLNPCLSIINELTRHYGCSAVICSATQPAINRSDYLKNGLETVREIIPDPHKLYESFRRVRTNIIPEKLSLDDIVDHLKSEKQALCVVNTRKEAREIFEQLALKRNPDECFHLSTMMCPVHRRNILKIIKRKLSKDLPCLLVSTQLIEAGVDIDFPAVYRAIAGIDSIAQAAGRCNREGRLKKGRVYIFNGQTPPPPGHLRQSADSGIYTLRYHSTDPLSTSAIKTYFEDYYGKENLSFDKNDIVNLCSRSIDAIPFREIASKFRLIEDISIPVIVPYGKRGRNIRDELKSIYTGFIPFSLKQKVQLLSVQLFENVHRAMRPAMEDVFQDGRYFILINPDIYDNKIGLKPEIPEYLKSESSII